MTIIINDKNAKTVAILDVTNYDEKFEAAASLDEGYAYHWSHACDVRDGQGNAIGHRSLAIDLLLEAGYDVHAKFVPFDAMAGKPAPRTGEDAIAFALPEAFDADALRASIAELQRLDYVSDHDGGKPATVVVSDRDGKTVAILEIANHDEKFKTLADLDEGSAWRWWCIDPAVGCLCALFAIDSFGYDCKTLFDAMGILAGKPMPAIPSDAVTYVLPAALDLDMLRDSIEDAHAHYVEHT